MAGIKDRLIQFILRGKDELSPEAKKSAEALEAVSQEATRLGQALDDAKGAQGLGKALERTVRDVALAQRNLSQAEQQVVDLREALNKEPEAAGLQQSLKDAERAAGRARRQLNALDAELADAEKAAKAAGIDTHNLGDEQQRLANEVTRAQQALAANNQELKEAQRAHAAAARSAAEHTSRVDAVRAGMSSGAKQVLGFAAAFVSLNAIMGLVQKGLNLVRDGIYAMLGTGDQYELLGKRMSSLMGGIAQGEQATAWIKTFAKDTPLEVTEVTEAFALLKSYGLDPMGGSLQAIVDKNEQLGGGMERLQGISSALGQAYAKQKLQTEEILQLVERGVPAWTLLEKVTGKNAAQLAELASKGKLGRDVIAGLIEEMGRSAEGAAADNMSTLTGLVSNLSDTWSDFLNRIAKSGALDYAKEQLKGVADYIDQMDKDGRLDKLATSLSNAFQQGVERVKEFARELVGVDFTKLTDDTTVWLNNFGQKLDEAKVRLEAFWAPFRTMGNVITGGLSQVAASFIAGAAQIVSVAEELGKVLPDKLGGQALVEKSQSALQVLNGLYEGFSKQAQQDVEDIGDAWDITSQHGVDAQKEVVDAAAQAAAQRAALDESITAQEVANRARAKAAAIDAAASGQQAIEGMAQALQLVNTASTVQQLESLRGALLAAYQSGAIGQEEYAQATTLLNGRLKDLGSAAGGAANLVSDLDEKLGDLAQVQAAIGSAKTDVDINNIRAALRKLYNDGEISAAQYNEELKKTSAQQKELKGAVEQGAKAQRAKTEAEKEAIVTSEDLRRASGKRMEEERRALGEAMEARRKGSEEVKQDSATVASYVDAVMARAREPLAQLSAAALEAFDRLRGLGTTKVAIDTSSLEQTANSLERVSQQLASVQAAASGPGLSGFSRWQLSTLSQSLRLQEATLGQKLQLQSLMQAYEDGSLGLDVFVRRAQSARGSMALLDDADLGQLDSAIASAQQRMQQLGDASRNTLDGLRDELDRLQGNEEDIERRRYAARQRELKAQLAEAQGAGDAQSVADLTQALGVLRQIQTATEEQRAKQSLEKQSQPAVGTAAPPAAQQPARIIRLESPRGRAVEVSVADAASETGLLDLLADAGLRTL
ncbi:MULTISPECIES: tape measure protein [unclassified Pseudomonas]|uniref:tape measure protein n=1 Tax=unclassified Pseudomonas TaxID=196821 RepID=UPI00244871D4|nr:MULTISPECIES: tape measure protein [unclassified Pseudomonas]MDG9926115.1 tape measure protein [Pseudomonas sp. GD04045]MDH0037459.1 tape measure protein [Pseudomonas sp. GD04019]